MNIDIWHWLRECKYCGKPHVYQESGNERIAGTWADRADGHPYNPRLHRSWVDQLEAEYRAGGHR